MNRTIKGVLSAALIIAVACCLLPAAALAAGSRRCYTIFGGNTPVYSNTGLTTKYGTIFGSDELSVITVTDRYTRVTYPISGGGTKTGYISTSTILWGTTGNNYTSRAKITTYKRPGGASYGYVSAGDRVVILGSRDGYTQVKYPVSGGYKYAFIKTTESNAYLTSGSSGNTSPDMNTGDRDSSTPDAGVYTGTDGTSAAQRIVDYELTQVGTGDQKGNNRVKYNTWYYGREVSGSGYAWCMAFQAYCAAQSGILNTAIPRTASCDAAASWYKNRGQFQYGKYYGGSYTPKAGDLVFYYSGGRCNHVGMVTAAPVNGYLQTVEGNIKCIDGDWKVVRFTKNSRRTINSSYVYGYGVSGLGTGHF